MGRSRQSYAPPRYTRRSSRVPVRPIRRRHTRSSPEFSKALSQTDLRPRGDVGTVRDWRNRIENIWLLRFAEVPERARADPAAERCAKGRNRKENIWLLRPRRSRNAHELTQRGGDGKGTPPSRVRRRPVPLPRAARPPPCPFAGRARTHREGPSRPRKVRQQSGRPR